MNDQSKQGSVDKTADKKPDQTADKTWQRGESVQDRLIREAQERGEFDNLPGYGRPIPNLTSRGSEDWVTNWVQREDLSGVLPPELALRKEADQIVDTVEDLRTEAEVREVVEGLNRRIREMRLRPPSGHNRGPESFLRTVSADRVVREWRERQ